MTCTTIGWTSFLTILPNPNPELQYLIGCKGLKTVTHITSAQQSKSRLTLLHMAGQQYIPATLHHTTNCIPLSIQPWYGYSSHGCNYPQQLHPSYRCSVLAAKQPAKQPDILEWQQQMHATQQQQLLRNLEKDYYIKTFNHPQTTTHNSRTAVLAFLWPNFATAYHPPDQQTTMHCPDLKKTPDLTTVFLSV